MEKIKVTGFLIVIIMILSLLFSCDKGSNDISQGTDKESIQSQASENIEQFNKSSNQPNENSDVEYSSKEQIGSDKWFLEEFINPFEFLTKDFNDYNSENPRNSERVTFLINVLNKTGNIEQFFDKKTGKTHIPAGVIDYLNNKYFESETYKLPIDKTKEQRYNKNLDSYVVDLTSLGAMAYHNQIANRQDMSNGMVQITINRYWPKYGESLDKYEPKKEDYKGKRIITFRKNEFSYYLESVKTTE